MKTIKVTQNATMSYAPDSTVIEVTLASENKKHSDAVKQLREQTGTTLSALTSAGLKSGELTTSGTAVSTVRHDGKTAYRASVNVKITLGITDERTENVVNAIEQSGAQWHIHYALINSNHKNELIQKAVAAAKEAAHSIADAAGVTLGTLAGVEYTAQFGGARMMRMAAADIAPQPEQIEETEIVTCEWEII